VNNAPGFQFPITLLIPGGMITGRLIGHTEYMKYFGQAMYDVAGGEATPGADTIRDGFLEQQRTAVADMKEGAAHGVPIDYNLPEFVHLTGARLAYGNVLIPQPGAVVRLRLRDVSGYFVGELGIGS
jgi:hypothetical protein